MSIEDSTIKEDKLTPFEEWKMDVFVEAAYKGVQLPYSTFRYSTYFAMGCTPKEVVRNIKKFV